MTITLDLLSLGLGIVAGVGIVMLIGAMMVKS